MSSVLHLMPDKNFSLKFQNVKYKTQAPFVIYVDLKSLLHPIDSQCGKTHRLSYHEPCAAAAILISKYPAIINRTFIESGDNALDNFF